MARMEDFQQLIESEKISEEHAQKLSLLKPETFCFHRSWGYGQIREWDFIQEQVIVDFDNKAGHLLHFTFAATSLTPLSEDHIVARKKRDPEAMKKLAIENPLEVMRSTIASLGATATGEAIEKILVPDVVLKKDWKKWWENTKRAMKKNGGFLVPTSKTAPFKILAKKENQNVSLSEAAQVRGITPQIELVKKLIQRGAELANKAEEVKAVLEQVEATLRRTNVTQKADLLKLALSRDELAELVKMSVTEDVSTPKLAGLYETILSDVVVTLSAPDQLRLFQAIKQAEPITWQAAILKFLPVATARLIGTIRDFFEKEGQLPVFFEALKRAVREQSLSSEALIWICKNRKGEVAFLIEPRFFNALLSAIERDQIGEKRSAKLHDLVLSDKTLLTDLIEGAGLDAVRDVTRGLILTTVFDEMNKRSLLARIIRKYPEMQSLVSASTTRSKKGAETIASTPSVSANERLIVSWESLEKRKAELDELINKKIPANTQEIAVARSYGDLRENAEFKFAKEQQRVLSRRRAELEAELIRAQGTDFSDVNTNRVGLGCRVVLEDAGKEVSYSILGAWDGNPERHIVSYLTPLAKALLNKQPGETAEIPNDKGEVRTVTIKSISRHAA